MASVPTERTDSASPGDASPARLARERDLYLRLLRLGTVSAIEPLLRESLELVVEISDALQAYVEIRDPEDAEGDGWSLAHECTHTELADIRTRISRGVIAEALAHGETVETISAMLDERFRARESVKIGRIEAVLCAPIGAHPPIGVVYLHGSRNGEGFASDAREKVELLAAHLTPLADRLLERHRQQRDRDPTRLPRAAVRADAIVGRSEAVATLLRQVALFAPLDVAVLIRGAEGSGRRLLARVLHDNSPRAGKPLVEVGCRDDAPEALALTLFGDGAGRPGRIAEARGGSLLLRNVDALALASQARLLALLDAARLASPADAGARVDVRLFVTTDADLAAAVRNGHFREDLLHRLQTLTVRVPALAERPRDVGVLARHFAAHLCEQRRAPRIEFSVQAIARLEAAEWPANVAALEAVVERVVERALTDGAQRVEARHVADAMGDTEHPSGPLTFQAATREFQKSLLARVLKETQWNVSAAARQLDLTRAHVYNLINAFGLTRTPP